MTILDVLKYPDPRLRIKAEPVAEVTPEIRQLMHDMVETMIDQKGIGLAATQVGVAKRVIVVSMGATGGPPIGLVNPEIKEASEELAIWEEACLSLPGVAAQVTRPARVTVSCINEKGEPYELNCGYILAACIQHEIDHLNGKVFIDHLSRLRQDMLKKKMKKQQLRAF